MKLYQILLLLCIIFVQLIYAHGIHHHDEEEEEDHDHEELGDEHDEHDHDHDEKQYAVWVTLVGVAGIIICSFIGTVLPLIFSKKSFFKENSVLFSCVKLFGTGIILSTAFIHMIVPADQILTSEYTYKLFNEKYTSFAGVFAILGIIITHLVQVYTSHFIKKNSDIHSHGTNSSDITIVYDKKCSEIDIASPENIYHEKNSRTVTVPAVDGCVEEQHGILHLMENKEKQIISYLLEIGISLHSVLIGVAYGMTRDKELIALMIALMFHQFFEGISLSSVFIEAHFKRSLAIIIMVITYTCTLPIGAIIGLIIRSAVESTDTVYLTTQGIIDAIAGGILIYDDVVNILSRHCNSMLFRNCSLSSKNVQLIAFYLGLFAMALIGIWA